MLVSSDHCPKLSKGYVRQCRNFEGVGDYGETNIYKFKVQGDNYICNQGVDERNCKFRGLGEMAAQVQGPPIQFSERKKNIEI
jgi:hypothetical protein